MACSAEDGSSGEPSTSIVFESQEDEISGVTGEVRTAAVLAPDGASRYVQYVLSEGRVIVGGDMDYGAEADVLLDEASSARPTLEPLGNFRTGTTYRWPDNGTHITIPYVLDRASFTDAEYANVKQAMDTIHAQSRVRFVPRNGQTDYVNIFRGTDTCRVGRQGGAQNCGPSGNYWHVSMHELGHAIGLQHEHQRANRDKHVVFHPDRTLRDGEFAVLWAADATPVGTYDFNSIMHYGPTQFSSPKGAHVLTPNFTTYPNAKVWPDPAALIKPLTTRTGFSAGDLAAIDAMYPPSVRGIQYQAYVETIGWQAPQSNGALAGTEGQSLRLEAINISLEKSAASNADVCYQAHVENDGWQDTRCNAQTAGTTGRNLRMEAIKIWLVNPPAGKRVCYRTHVQDIGWQDEVCDGQLAGTTAQARRIEAIRIRLVD